MFVQDENGQMYTYTVAEKLVHGYYTIVDGYDITNVLLPSEVPNDGTDPENPTPDIKTPRGFAPPSLTEAELQNLISLLDYGVPLWGGLLGTGDEVPAYPYVFTGIGFAALLALALTIRKKRSARN